MGICDQVMCLRLIKVMMQLLEQLLDDAFVITEPDGDVAVALGGNDANVFSASDIVSVRCAVIWETADAPLKHRVIMTAKRNESMTIKTTIAILM